MHIQVASLGMCPSNGERAVRIYLQAKSFGEAAYLLVSEGQSEPRSRPPGLIAPMVTTSAFAIELFLKSVSAASGERPSRKHALLALFQALPEKTRAMIEAEFYVVAGRQKDLLRTLEMMNDAFSDWRYAYESRKRGLMFKPNDALMVIKAIDNVCRSLLVDQGLMLAAD